MYCMADSVWTDETVEKLRQTMPIHERPVLYLAGPVRRFNRSDEVRKRFAELAEDRSFTLVDPLNRNVDDRENIPEADVDTLSFCDGVLMYYVPCEVYGTPAELYLASLADYPIVAVDVGKSASVRHKAEDAYSPWMEDVVDDIVLNKTVGIEKLLNRV